MAINFPNSPTNGQIFTNPTNGITYQYSTVNSTWDVTYNNVGFSLSVTSQNFVANGTQNTFSLSNVITNTNNVIVTVNGLVMTPIVDYVFAGSTMNFQYIPSAGDEVEVKNLGSTTSSQSKNYFYGTIIGG